MKIKITLLIGILFLLAKTHFAQDYEAGRLYITIQNAEAIPELHYDASGIEIIMANSELKDLYEQYGIYYFERAFPIVDSIDLPNTYDLEKVYFVALEGNEQDLMSDLTDNYGDYFIRVEKIPSTIELYTPNDYHILDSMLYGSNLYGPNYALDIINAKDAWDITKGDSSVIIGIIDTGFWTEHEELENKIAYEHSNSTDHIHGTGVASLAAGDTDNNLGMSSIGFDCKLAIATIYGYLPIAHPIEDTIWLNPGYEAILEFASMGFKVINCSWGGKYYSTTHQNVIHLATDMGSLVVCGAGNGNFPGYNYGNQYFYPASYDRALSVSSIGSDLKHVYNDTLWHTHNDSVDICAPGYDIIYASIDPSVNYYAKTSGTSFASPIVAGLAGLIVSIDPTLTPSEITAIIKQSAQPIADGNLFGDSLGAGVIDAFAAVDLAANCTPLIITGIETWSKDKEFFCNIIVDSCAELTIKSTVRFSDRAKIIVKRGGKLIIDEGILTNLHAYNKPWRGIEVWGNSQLSHSPPTNHGLVYIKNGGVIENAVTGIKTYRPISDYIDDCVYGYTGGIVFADNAMFRNNRIAVEFLPHHFENNLSFFKDCVFVTDDNLLDGSFPEYFVKLSGVRGIDFKGCSFSNTLDGPANSPNRGSGIFAASADVQIFSLCTYPYALPIGEPCPEEYVQPSEFKKLYYGVYAANTGVSRKVKIENSKFDKNYRGAFISALDFASITQNTFNVYDGRDTQILEDYGLYIEGSKGFSIEENHFFGNNVSGNTGNGLVISNSGPEANIVYNNYFQDLKYASIAHGQNRNRQYDNLGLCFKCNDYFNNEFDIYVNSDTTGLDQGIARNQGAAIDSLVTAPAGNTFSASGHNYNYVNATANPIIYYRHSATLEDKKIIPEPTLGPITISSVPNTTYSKGLACPSNLGGGDPPVEKQRMLMAEGQAGLLSYELALLIDDGDTETKTSDVNNTSTLNADDTYADLLNVSPYLSDTVLKTTIVKEDVFNNTMIRDVMVANPQSGKSEDILDMLEAKFDPMPENMLADIYDGRLIVGNKEMLEAEIAHWGREGFNAFSNLFRNYSFDTVNNFAPDSLAALLSNRNSAGARYILAFKQLESQGLGQALQTLATIPLDFTLETYELAMHQGFSDLADVWDQIMNDTVYFVNPTQSQVAALTSLYQANLGLPSVYARNILLAVGELEYDEQFIISLPLKRERIYRRSGQPDQTPDVLLKVFPNPANNYITVEYKLPDDVNSAALVITNLQGVVMHTESLPLHTGNKQFSLKTFNPGFYIVQLYLNNKPAASQRVSIIN